MMFGVAEDHDSNPIKIGLASSRNRGAKFVSVNPVKHRLFGDRRRMDRHPPGTDGLLVLALIHELLQADKIDLDYLVRYTNAPWLVIQDPGAADDGLFARDADGEPLCWDSIPIRPPSAWRAMSAGRGRHLSLSDGRKAVPSFQLLAERYLDENTVPTRSPSGPASRPTPSAASPPSWRMPRSTGNRARRRRGPTGPGASHDKMIGRPVAMHAMRGISAHSNGFQTCRALHLLQMLLGSIDVPGGFRYKPPFPSRAAAR